PSVSVPVLSNTTRSNLNALSNATLFRINKPSLAAMEVDLDVTSGVAKPSACGQAIINTVTIRSKAKSKSPLVHQTAKVIIPTTTATQNNHLPAISAKPWAFDFDFSASLTNLITWDR